MLCILTFLACLLPQPDGLIMITEYNQALLLQSCAVLSTLTKDPSVL